MIKNVERKIMSLAEFLAKKYNELFIGAAPNWKPHISTATFDLWIEEYEEKTNGHLTGHEKR